MPRSNERSDARKADTGGRVARRLYTVTETADALNIGRRTVWRLLAARQLPSVRLGRSVRVPADAIDALIQRGGSA